MIVTGREYILGRGCREREQARIDESWENSTTVYLTEIKCIHAMDFSRILRKSLCSQVTTIHRVRNDI